MVTRPAITITQVNGLRKGMANRTIPITPSDIRISGRIIKPWQYNPSSGDRPAIMAWTSAGRAYPYQAPN